MTQQFNITRGSKESQVIIGTTTEGKSRLYFEDVEVGSDGLKERWFFVSLYVGTDRTLGIGEVNHIKTEWCKAKLSPTGEIIFGTEITELMITNESDITTFIAMFGTPILMSMTNGLVRDIWGFNHLPVFNTTTGAILTYTGAQESSLPTNDYRP